MVQRYPNIFQTGRIGKLETKNRIKYAATETNFPYSDGYVSDREVAYMEAQAKGGAAIVTTQGAYPDEKGEGKGFRGSMAIYDDRFIPGLARIADVIRANGALSCLQILHCGREGGVELDYCLMPSVVPQKLSYFKPPREMNIAEIKRAVHDHVEAARRAKEAGFDMIELSGIVGYLISTFVSRYTNKRSDEYGGNLEQRCRLMVEIIEGIRSMVGDMPVGIRLCGLELLDDRGGNTLEESIRSFQIAEEAGADYVSVTVGWHESSQSVITRDVPMGHWLPIAEQVKNAVGIPVMMAFRQFTPSIPEKAIAQAQIDYWEMCRPMISDPDLPSKIQKGREDQIIPCIACNLCFSRLYYHQPIMCSVRPSLGHEGEKDWGYYGFAPAVRKRKIVIVGAGPAGLQCAAVAAQRAHAVTVYEQNKEIGGNLLLASKVDKGAIELLRPVQMLEALCTASGVQVRTGTTFNQEMLDHEAPDALIIASGGTVKRTPFKNVFTPEDIISGKKQAGRRVLILGGKGAGLGIAVFLLSRGQHEITLVEESGKMGTDVNPFYLWQYLALMKKKGAAMLTMTRVLDIRDNSALLSGESGNKEIPVDTVIMSLFDPAEASYLTRSGLEIHYIGDAKKPRRLNNAVHDAFRLGMVL